MGVGRSARIDAVGRSAIKLCDFGKVISCPWAAVTGRDGVVTFEVTFNDYHLEHWGSKRESPWGAGGMQALRGSADSEEGQGKAGYGEHCGPVQLRCSVLGRCVLHCFLAWLASY